MTTQHGPVDARIDGAPGRTHTQPSRGQTKGGRSVVPESKLIAGRFGRLFRNLPSYEPSDETIADCVKRLSEPPDAGASTALDNPDIMAGFTYLGQFIDHDLTFDPVSSLERQNDPDGLRNFRSPNFDLDSVYGQGPADQPYLYQKHDPVRLLIGKGQTINPQSGSLQPTDEDDLPRNADGIAIIGDPRNDENIIVGQLHLAFLKLHNRIVSDIRNPGQNGGADLRPHLWSTGNEFQEAQRLTRWHYQWVVLEDFLPRICGRTLMTELLETRPVPGLGTYRKVKELSFYDPESLPYIPVEWSVAAYRFGHSMVRPTYNLNRALTQVNPDLPIFIENPPESPTDPLFLKHLGGGRHLPFLWSLDWRFFFEQNVPGTPPARRQAPQPARLIDTQLAPGLSHVPVSNGTRILAERNLVRGRTMGLPSGEAIARRMGVKPLTRDELDLGAEAPLWFYVLKEAELLHRGRHLGPVGGRIVAEVFLGILERDPFSFLRTEPAWKPVLPALNPRSGRWGMADLLAYAVPDDGRRLTLPGPGGPPPPPAPR